MTEEMTVISEEQADAFISVGIKVETVYAIPTSLVNAMAQLQRQHVSTPTTLTLPKTKTKRKKQSPPTRSAMMRPDPDLLIEQSFQVGSLTRKAAEMLALHLTPNKLYSRNEIQAVWVKEEKLRDKPWLVSSLIQKDFLVDSRNVRP